MTRAIVKSLLSNKKYSLNKVKKLIKIGFGTDVVGDMVLMSRQNEEFTNRAKWFSNFEVLRQATSGNAQLMTMSGPRNPYPGKLGVIEEGAYADIPKITSKFSWSKLCHTG